MHDEIRKFTLSGPIVETAVVQTRERLIFEIESEMRDYGYVPSLDNEPQFSTGYNGEDYEFSLSVYGIKVGKEKAWNVSGMTGGKEIMKYTPKSRLSLSLANVELKSPMSQPAIS